MNRPPFIDLKERIAISDAFTPWERDFLLGLVNGVVNRNDFLLWAAPDETGSPTHALQRDDLDNLYLVWSNEHRGWWRNLRGYTPALAQAARFARGDAMKICRNAIPQAAHIGGMSEIPVRLADVECFLQGQIIPAVIISE